MEKTVRIKNKSGLHARPAGMFVKEASKFRSDVDVISKDRKVNAKSIMGIMSLGLSQGEEIKIVVNGIDEEEALQSLVDLVENEFDEK
ncbi:HPr family phosphocarrier protein [Clostridioides mangenotii]|uniref:HPr family phosphocarrier protein n=1 Tax=Metaclostridioides mangenotii TaxID=1540 RepID=UPI001C100A7B|nr:HPr family phosphocarrier protein [Clostridioides mangenotii]MBU5306833.1 HPr family phosphocarrier protein [Clostridioides mangenotii]MCR1953599.1 HPr family phosphocarrier protein [Clostridioides mangenotii]